MNLLEINRYDEVVLARLNHGVTNAINLEMVYELKETVEQVRSDSAVRALVFASANEKFFSIGFDIPQLFAFSQEEFKSFFRAFNQVCLDLYTLPKPTVAALNGHAIAGGCILALCFDYRLIGQGRKLMGLNEIKLGVPVPYIADCCLRALIGVRQARDVMESGEFFGPEATARMGMVDEVLPDEKVVELAVEKGRQLGALPAAAYGAVKRNRVEGIQAEVTAKWDEKERFFVESWCSEEVRRRLREAMEKF
jgi:enoyl-CoA hydratase/carnithine racemase